jgi:hypothetical protein
MTEVESVPVLRRFGGRLATAAGPVLSFLRSVFVPVVLVAAMAAVAFAFGRRELLFPEYGALTAGVLSWRLPPWTARPVDIFVLPALAALLGVGLNLSRIPFAIAWGVGLGVILYLLRVARSHMVPSISAVLLPLLLHFTSLLYPLAVAGTSLVLCVIAFFRKNGAAPAPRIPQPPIRLVGTYWALAMIVGLLACYAGPRYLAAPPILVALLELMKTKADRGFAKLAGLVAASAIGVCLYALIPNWALCGIAVFLCVFLVCRALRIVLPPALALGILPMLIRENQQLDFLAGTAAGALLIIGGATIFFRASSASKIQEVPVTAAIPVPRPSLDEVSIHGGP